MYYDQVIFDFLSNTASDYMTDFMLFITRFGAEYVVFLMLSLVLVFLFFDRLKEALLLLIATGGAFFLNAFVKDIIDRTRPIVGIPVIQAEGYSFPSGHAMISICFYGVLIYLAFKYIKNIKLKYLIYLILGLLILFIGLSRVYLGVHYLSDVLGGFSLGIFWLSLCILFYRVISITNFSDNS
jgi:undecaprenyl-diphosphatase